MAAYITISSSDPFNRPWMRSSKVGPFTDEAAVDAFLEKLGFSHCSECRVVATQDHTFHESNHDVWHAKINWLTAPDQFRL